jgi:GT2 family glycosyltransferase
MDAYPIQRLLGERSDPLFALNDDESAAKPKTTVMLSLIIVSYNANEVLRQCLQSVLCEIEAMSAQLYRPSEASQAANAVQVIVIDNASSDGTVEMLQTEFSTLQLFFAPSNLGFASANNLGFACAKGRYLALLNPDAVLSPGTLGRALSLMQAHPQVGMAGGLLQDPQGNWQPSGRMFPSLLNESIVISGLAARFPKSRLFGRFDRTWADQQQAAAVDWIPGAFTMICRHALAKVGNFDERFFLYYEEVDLCRRMCDAGYQVWYWPQLVVTHIGGVSAKSVAKADFSQSGSQLSLWRMRSALLYYRKHHGALTAWLLAQLEIGWNRLRLLRQLAKNGSLDQAQKNQQLRRNISLMQQAWQDTAGGTHCPPRPW